MITLCHDQWQVGVDPLGACLAFARWNEIDILRPRKGDITDPINAACFPCVPYFGRIAKGVNLQGQFWPLTPNHWVDQQNAIHGEGWLNDWAVRWLADNSILLAHESPGVHAGQYPFAWKSEQKITLDARKLHIRLSLTSQHDSPAPFGLGLHPFFLRTPSTRLQFEYRAAHQPPGMEKINLAPLPFPQASALPDFMIDCSFKDWDGTVQLIEENNTPSISLKSDAQHLHLFAPEGEDYFCLEPITQLPGAYQDQDMVGQLMLAPGETRSLSMTINVA